MVMWNHLNFVEKCRVLGTFFRLKWSSLYYLATLVCFLSKMFINVKQTVSWIVTKAILFKFIEKLKRFCCNISLGKLV